MREDLSNVLRQKYPLIFGGKPCETAEQDMVPSPFSIRGFECSDGWFDVLDVLCTMLQLTTQRGAPQICVRQVKEKFGRLVFAASGADVEQRAMIELATAMSERLCEICGGPGQTFNTGWIKTRCHAHLESD